MNKFFIDIPLKNTKSSNASTSTETPPHVSSPIISHPSNIQNELQASNVTLSTNVISNMKDEKSSNIYREELGNHIFLSLHLQNYEYFIYLREFSNEGIPAENVIYIDIPTWYEFQYKVLAFNLRYISS